MSLFIAKPLPQATNDIQEKKAELLTLRRNTPEGRYRLKSHHFLNNILAKREMGNSVDMEGVFLTADGYVAEGVVSNLFWVKNKTVYTPAVETGILNGITRQFILKLAVNCGYRIEDGLFKPRELDDAEEIFITNSIQEIVGIKQWNNKAYPGRQGEVTQLFYNQYRNYCSSLYSRDELS